MENKPHDEEQRRRWRERQQRSRANRAAKEEEDDIWELVQELKRAIRESRDGKVPCWFFATHGVTATVEAMRFLGIAPPRSDKPTDHPNAPSPPEKGWWIGMESKQILARLAETNPRLVETLFRNRTQTIEPQEDSDGPA